MIFEILWNWSFVPALLWINTAEPAVGAHGSILEYLESQKSDPSRKDIFRRIDNSTGYISMSLTSLGLIFFAKEIPR